MKLNTSWMVAVVIAASWNGTSSQAAESSYETQRREAAATRAKDPAWQASTTEAGLIQIGDGKRSGALRNFCLNAEGNILACYAPPDLAGTSKSSGAIRVYSPEGKLLETWPLEIKPTAIAVAQDRSIFAAGDGRLVKLDATGKVLASAASPVADEPVVINQEIEAMVRESIKHSTGKTFESEVQRMKTSLEKRRKEVNGLAVTGQDVFITTGSPSDFSYRIYRFDQTLANPKLVVEKLRGCCGQMDVQAHDGKLMVPHNARHAIETRDRDGKQLSKFGTKGRAKPSDFGGCCEPKNMRVLANGEILAAESGPPTCIKRFSADGKLLEVVAVLETKGECVRVTVERSPDGSRYYLMDTERDAIRVFKVKG
jgi:hypothetical protein